MKGLFTVAIVLVSLSVPLLAAAEGSNMIGADRAAIGGGEHGTQTMAGLRGAADLSEGEVRKVDTAADKLTLRHGALASLDMPAMTMVFRVKDPAWLNQLKVGERVRFVVERVDGNVTVTALEPEPQ